MARDDFWDASAAGLDMPRNTDPDAGTPEWTTRRRRWREESAKKNQNVERYLTDQARQGIGGDDALNAAGFYDEPDQGRATFRQYGDEGLYATQGSAVDPNLDYDWGRGIATWRAGTDNAGQSRPINETERAEYVKAQQNRQNGLKGYGQMNNAYLFQNVEKGNWTKDPATGVSWNQKPDGTFAFRDQYGRATSAPIGWKPPAGVGAPPSAPAGSYLPDAPGSDLGGSGPVADYNQAWAGLATGQPAIADQGYSPIPVPSTRDSKAQAEKLDSTSPYQKLVKKSAYGTGTWGASTPGGSNGGLKVGA